MGSKITVKNFVQNLANVLQAPGQSATLSKANIQKALGISTAVASVVPSATQIINQVAPTLNELVSYLHLLNVSVNTVTAFANTIIDSTPQLFWDTLDYIPLLFWRGYSPIPLIGATTIPDLTYWTNNLEKFKSEKDKTEQQNERNYQYILTSKDKVIQNLKRDIATLRSKIATNQRGNGTNLAPDVIVTVRPC